MRISIPEYEYDFPIPPQDSMSEEEFFQFCAANPELNLERDKDGNIIIIAPANHDSSWQEDEAGTDLTNWNRKHKAGRVYSSSVGFTMPDGAVRSPDAAWIAQHRVDALSAEDRQRFAHICPDFVMEFRSKTDRLKDVLAKMDEWLENGCRLAFLIDPAQRRTWSYKPGREPIEMIFPCKLSGEEVLPGFELDTNIFEE